MAAKLLINIQHLAGRPAPYLQRLRDAGFELIQNNRGRLLTEDELIAALPGVFATVAGGEPYTERVFAAAPALRVVARLGVGYDKVDVDAATRHGVIVAMAFGTNHESVADYAFALMIGLASRLLPHHRSVAAGDWAGGFHAGLAGRTVGIVGLGRIGQAVAARCRGFGTRILGTDPVVDTGEAAARGITLVPLDQLLAEADFVSLHAPRTPATQHMIDAAALARMKPTAFLVNTARGGLIDEAALHAALTQGRIAGAGLDVFETEPPVGSPLLGLDNVILAPHAAGLDEGAEAAMAARCIDHILAVHRGDAPRREDVLNPALLDR